MPDRNPCTQNSRLRTKDKLISSREIILISYDSGVSGSVTSEWLKDKLLALQARETNTLLITSTLGEISTHDKLNIKRVHSWGFDDFSRETSGTDQFAPSPPLLRKLVTFTFGRALDVIFRWAAGSASDGRWFWTVPAGLAAGFEARKNPNSVIVTTGGPSSAHFAGVIANFCSGRPLIVELQDPFIGSEMRMSSRASWVMAKFERILCLVADKIVTVTHAAAASMKDRNPESSKKIFAIYPGAWKHLPDNKAEAKRASSIVIGHIGTLYGSRNLDNFFLALDSLREKGGKHVGKVEVRNIGATLVENRETYLSRPDFISIEGNSRLGALALGRECDLLLVVQHSDSRSHETIPFKTYDCLQLGKPIFALSANSELDGLVSLSSGWTADPSSVPEIEAELSKAIVALANDVKLRSVEAIGVDTQLELLLRDV